MVQFRGKAEHVGSGLANGKLSLSGTVKSVNLPDLRLTVLNVQRLLFDRASGAELVRRSGREALLPLLLSPRPHQSATKAIYQTDPGVVPKVRIELEQQDPGKGEVQFQASMEHVTIDEPLPCTAAQGSASLRTQIVLTSTAGGAPIAIATEQQWMCADKVLQTP